MIAKDKCVRINRFWSLAAALTVSAVCFASANASAQVSKTRNNDGSIISQTSAKATTLLQDGEPPVQEALPAGATVIYSNFGPKRILYNGQTGWTEAGAEANDYPLAEAMAFVPTSNYAVVRIEAAFQWVFGTNGVTMILAADNQGAPGKVLYSTFFSDLPTFGTCCVVQTAKIPVVKGSSVTLKAGQTYWIYPLPADTTSYLVWSYDVTKMGGPGAVSEDLGNTWTPTTYQTFGAFELFGMKLGE